MHIGPECLLCLRYNIHPIVCSRSHTRVSLQQKVVFLRVSRCGGRDLSTDCDWPRRKSSKSYTVHDGARWLHEQFDNKHKYNLNLKYTEGATVLPTKRVVLWRVRPVNLWWMWRDRMDYSTIIPLKCGLSKPASHKKYGGGGGTFKLRWTLAAPHNFFSGVDNFRLATASGFGGCGSRYRTWQSCSGNWSHFKMLDT